MCHSVLLVVFQYWSSGHAAWEYVLDIVTMMQTLVNVRVTYRTRPWSSMHTVCTDRKVALMQTETLCKTSTWILPFRNVLEIVNAELGGRFTYTGGLTIFTIKTSWDLQAPVQYMNRGSHCMSANYFCSPKIESSCHTYLLRYTRESSTDSCFTSPRRHRWRYCIPPICHLRPCIGA